MRESLRKLLTQGTNSSLIPGATSFYSVLLIIENNSGAEGEI